MPLSHCDSSDSVASGTSCKSAHSSRPWSRRHRSPTPCMTRAWPAPMLSVPIPSRLAPPQPSQGLESHPGFLAVPQLEVRFRFGSSVRVDLLLLRPHQHCHLAGFHHFIGLLTNPLFIRPWFVLSILLNLIFQPVDGLQHAFNSFSRNPDNPSRLIRHQKHSASLQKPG
jgi:hypothetical protein